jgi:hypothetical protein
MKRPRLMPDGGLVTVLIGIQYQALSQRSAEELLVAAIDQVGAEYHLQTLGLVAAVAVLANKEKQKLTKRSLAQDHF